MSILDQQRSLFIRAVDDDNTKEAGGDGGGSPDDPEHGSSGSDAGNDETNAGNSQPE